MKSSFYCVGEGSPNSVGYKNVARYFPLCSVRVFIMASIQLMTTARIAIVNPETKQLCAIIDLGEVQYVM